MPMVDEDMPGDSPVEEHTAVGIVVHGSFRPAHPNLAFVWGPEVRPAPSLPFRRFRAEAKAAA